MEPEREQKNIKMGDESGYGCPIEKGDPQSGHDKARRPKVFIIVLNWNGRDDTIECLASLDRLSYPNYQVLVVDNGSEDGSVDAIRERFPGVDVIENMRNLGFAGGNNVGIREALKRGAEYVLLLNNDTIVSERDCLDPLIECVERKGNSIVGPLILYWPSDRIWFAGGKISWIIGFCRHRGKRSILSKWKKTEPCEVDYISGCALLLKRDVIEAVGLFDPAYFLYYEDADFCARAKAVGFKCFMVPQSRIGHKLSVSAGDRGSDRLSALQAYHFGRNGILFARKNLRGAKRILFLLGQLSFRLVYGLSHCQDAGALKAYLKGIRDGIEALKE